MLFAIFNISLRSRVTDVHVFKICKLAKWWRHRLDWILIKYDQQRYLSQFESEMFDFRRYDSTIGGPQYKPNIFVTVATYWVPDLPDIKGFYGHL